LRSGKKLLHITVIKAGMCNRMAKLMLMYGQYSTYLSVMANFKNENKGTENNHEFTNNRIQTIIWKQ